MKAWGRQLIGLNGKSWLVFRTDRESQRNNVNRSHVIRLNTTSEQEVYFRKACGLLMDRDHNAAINIGREALRLRTDVPVVASSERKFACGAGSSGSRRVEGETFCCEAGTKVL
jgi:hypothetical protein